MPTIEERAQALADSLATTVTTIAYGDSFEMDQERASAMILAFAQSVRAQALREAARHLERRGWYMPPDDIRDLIDATPSAPPADVTRPLDMLLWCPACHTQHVDAPDGDWQNPPHKSHLCHGCGTIWRPADVPTNGVAHIKTTGGNDTWSGKSPPSDVTRRVVRHKRRGTTYTVIGEAELQTEGNLFDGSRMVIYQGDDGLLWARQVEEFEDGRFEDVGANLGSRHD